MQRRSPASHDAAPDPRNLRQPVNDGKDLVEHAGVNPDRIDVVYNGADLERFNPRTTPGRRTNGICRNTQVAPPLHPLYRQAGTPRQESHERLLEAFARMKRG